MTLSIRRPLKREKRPSISDLVRFLRTRSKPCKMNYTACSLNKGDVGSNQPY
jgi:hypothetical protein